MIDYLAKLRGARNLDNMAMYLRAAGCKVAPMLLLTYSPEEAHDAIRQYERDAQFVERCESVGQARRYLKAAGYLGVNYD